MRHLWKDKAITMNLPPKVSEADYLLSVMLFSNAPTLSSLIYFTYRSQGKLTRRTIGKGIIIGQKWLLRLQLLKP